ncbi:hypothetical protein AHAS_Ahas17G0153600 [Arachis hypogaea]
MLSCYLQNGTNRKTIDIFNRIRSLRIPHNYATFTIVLKACLGIGDYCLGLQVHCLASRMGFDNNVVTTSALVDMYSKYKKLDNALYVFYEMPKNNLVCWSTVIIACVQNDQFIKSLKLFKDTLTAGIGVSQSTYASALSFCAGLTAFRLGTQLGLLDMIQLHGLAFDIYAANVVLDILIFKKAPKKKFVAWSAMICAYAYHGLGGDAVKLFEDMKLLNVKLNHTIFISILRACAHMGFVDRRLYYFRKIQNHYGIGDYCLGLQVHCLASPLGFNNVVMTSALVDMYSKCKKLDNTLQDTLKADIGVSQSTYASAFRSYARLAALSLAIKGQLDRINLHGLMVKCNLTLDICIANAILDMCVHEQNEEVEKTLSFFVSMLRPTVEPNDFTYDARKWDSYLTISPMPQFWIFVLIRYFLAEIEGLEQKSDSEVEEGLLMLLDYDLPALKVDFLELQNSKWSASNCFGK